jgi:O-acetyl-ADP-ribose deacetylase (regulator of RNase III)
MEMLKIIEQDLLLVENGVICNQTNCLGSMGAGIALAIKNKWPFVNSEYKAFCNQHPGHRSILLLGQCQLIQITPVLTLANIFGQHEYGRFNGVNTNYRAVTEAFQHLKASITPETQVYVPFNMGCGLAGGNWDEYQKRIEEIFPNAIVCKL